MIENFKDSPEEFNDYDSEMVKLFHTEDPSLKKELGKHKKK